MSKSQVIDLCYNITFITFLPICKVIALQKKFCKAHSLLFYYVHESVKGLKM